MKRVLIAALISGVVSSTHGHGEPATAAELEAAWLAFNHVRGAPALIKGDLEHPSANAIFRVIPDVTLNSLEENKIQLGFELFNEARLSRDGSVACSSCHIAMLGGVDRRPVSTGIGGAQGEFNAPTIFNAALNFRQFWDGRALTLQEQALGPIESPLEFGHDLEGALAFLESIPDYVRAFDELYPDGINAANLADALAYYQTMNFTGLDSPFLRQFDVNSEPMSAQAQRGQKRFVEVGCASCHNGINLGGNSYQKLGEAKAWYNDDAPATESDDGLYGRTHRTQDLHVFKVPGLHNVANTGPWMHDGSITSLQQAVDQMARKQSGRYLPNQDIDDIVAFLRALGDPRSLIGECSASGNYAVTMDCSVKRVASTATEKTELETSLPVVTELARLHQREYNSAANIVAEAPLRIEMEIERIRTGEVAHFDFLQFEHIEMLRHARALGFPPANLEAEQREELLAQAEAWQRQAASFELMIADFLRAFAVTNSAMLNYQDLLSTLSVEANEIDLALLDNARLRVEGLAAEPGADTLLALESATRALQGDSLKPELLAELQIQLDLLNKTMPAVFP